MRLDIGPLILILVGTFLLLSNLGIVRLGELKALAFTWWPALLILVGIMQLWKNK